MAEQADNRSGGFPTTRMRRLRYHPLVRELVRDVRLHPANFVLPLFVRAGRTIKQEIGSMPGQFQWSPDRLAEEVRAITDLGLGGVLLFGIPDKKDSLGSDSYSDSGIVQQGIRAVKSAAPNLLVITDVCFCEYTDHGHCGIIKGQDVDNDATLEILVKEALSHARAERKNRSDGCRQRRHVGVACQTSREPCEGRRRLGRPQRHDGRHD